MEFRPCIDIHNGKVKQIVGSSLTDQKNEAEENFVSKKDAAYYADLYKSKGLTGGHIILLNAKDSSYYEETKKQAMEALEAFSQGMQIGGGITAENAKEYIDAGASHVIVTSYVFQNGEILEERLQALKDAVGKKHIVLDLSARKYEDGYYVMTDRWQKKSQQKVDITLLEKLSAYCDEFLIHAVDVEGKNNGIEQDLVKLLASYTGCPITYAGGVHSYEDIDLLRQIGNGKIHMTIGSALDLFGGSLSFEKVCEVCL
ncbi:MAG: phosphoribosylformimino-5-aminoimidazole carboxamide ribotide isomerase [Lachnospiraceae bacterium]|nr:phosphoribosylformimino-5-aminoimidazole carboxamide ribotide isomerase [Lachnospiraceae bacterium]